MMYYIKEKYIMVIKVNEQGNIQMGKVYNPVVLVTSDNEEMIITMRDSGFEFTYQGEKYSAKNGKVEKISKIEHIRLK